MSDRSTKPPPKPEPFELGPVELAILDSYIAGSPDNPTRQEALQRILEEKKLEMIYG